MPLYYQFLRVWPALVGLNSGARITVSIAVCEDSHVLHSISGGCHRNCLVAKHGISHISKVCLILGSGVVMVKGGNVSALKSSTAHSTLVQDMATAIGTDGFLSGVLESLKDFNDNFFRNFFLDVNKVLCYQRAEDVRARVCVPAVC